MSYTFRVLAGGGQEEIPDFQKVSLGYDFSEQGVFSCEYAKHGINAELLVDKAIVIALWDGEEFFDSRFMIRAGEDDDNVEAISFKRTGFSLLNIFARVTVEEVAASPGKSIRFDSATAGGILDNLLTAAQARGAATGITWDFTNAVDSNGNAWSKAISLEYKLGLDYLSLLRNLVDQGMMEVRFDGTVLQAFNADTMGTDHSIDPDLVELQAGLDYEELPKKWSSEAQAKFSMTVGDEGSIVRKVDDSVPDGPFGREEMAVSQGGTKDVGTLNLVNDAALERVRQTREQLTRKIVIREDGPVPNVDYRVSDYVRERVPTFVGGEETTTSERYRVRSLVVEVGNDGEIGSASIVLNDKFLEAQIRTARKVSGIIGGASADGGGNGVPIEEKPDTTTPMPPTGLVMDSDAYIDSNGNTRTVMSLDWNAPTLNTDGSAITDLKEYEIQYRKQDDSVWKTAPRATTDYAYVSNMDPEVVMEARVRAWDNTTHVSAWSDTVSATMDNDTTPPPVPSTPTVTVYLGALLVTWDGKGSAGEDMPVDFAGCRVHVSTANDFDPSLSNISQTILAKNRTVTVPVSGLEYGVEHYVKLVSIDKKGNTSAASAQGHGVPRRVVEDDIEPGAITTGVVNFDARDLGAQTTFFGPSAPPSPNQDDLWVDESSNNQLKRWTGAAWIDVSDDRIATALTDSEQAAIDAQNAYDKAIAQAAIYYQTSAPTGLTSDNTNDLWIDTDDNQKVYRWTGSAWALTNLASTDYIASRATDLVTNGTGALGNNTNFSSLDFHGEDAPPGAAGSFWAKDSGYGGRQADELIPFDPKKKYKFAWQARQTVPGSTDRIYGYIAPYDADDLSMAPVDYTYITGTTTQLTQALNPGDTVVHVASVANWYGQASKPTSVTYVRSITWWDYVDGNGKAWPKETYSRNHLAYDVFADGAVNAVDNTITLKAPYAGPAKPVGTWLSQGTSGGSYMYMNSASNAIVPETWTPFSDVFDKGAMTPAAQGITGTTGAATWNSGVPYATAKIKIGWLLNANPSPANAIEGIQALAAISFSDASAAQSTADAKNIIFSQTSQPSTVGRVNGDLWYDTDDGNQLYVWTGSAWTASDLGTQAINFTARDIGAITTYWQTSAPTGTLKIGDLWIDTDDKNKTYRWSGAQWDLAADQRIADAITAAAGAQATADGKVKTFSQAAAPVASGTGDLWVDTDDNNKLYRWSGSAWVAVDDGRIAAQAAEIATMQSDLANVQSGLATARAIADGRVDTFFQTSPPTGGTVSEGDIWVDTDANNAAYRRDAAGTWVAITDTRATKALSDAAAAQAAADGKITSYYQASAPTGMTDSNAGDLWFDTDDGNKAYWYRPSSPGPAGWVAVPFGGNAIAPGSLSMSNLVSEIRASLGQVFTDDFSDVSRWIRDGGSGTFASVAATDAQTGSNVGRSTSYSYMHHSTQIPFDPNELYRITARFRANPDTSGEVTYIGVRGLDRNGAYVANYYVACSALEAVGAWTTVTGYLKGTDAAPTAGSPKPDPKTPGTVATNVRFLQPLMLLNYNDTTGKVTEVDLFKVESVPTGLVERANIALAAINSALIEDAAVINAKIANLAVTNAKINDLAANKITTAELAAGVRIIAGPETGTHAEVTATGFYAYVEDPVDGIPNEAVRIGTDGDTIGIIDPATGATLASISQDGVVSAQSGSFLNDIEVQGEDLVGNFLDISPGLQSPFRGGVLTSLPGGLVQWGAQYTASSPTDNTTGVGIFEILVPMYRGRMYKFMTNALRVRSTVANAGVEIRGYRTTGTANDPEAIPAAPTVNDQMLFRVPVTNVDQTAGEGILLQKIQAINAVLDDPAQLPGTFAYNQRVLLAIARVTGSGNVWVDGSTLDPIEFWVEDIGPYSDNAGQASDGGGGLTGTPKPPPSTATPKTYSKTFYSTSSATYQGGGSKRSDTSDVVQGYNSYNGDGKGLWIFPSMTSYLSGATVNKVEVYAYANHWYYNSGGTALIKVHGYSAAPASSPAMTTAISSANWPKPGGRWVTLPSSLYAGFKSGTYKGFGVGPAGSTNLLYYGRFNGGTGARIRVTYTK